MYDWTITLEAWPFSTNKGEAADQETAGPRGRALTVRADDIGAALRLAEVFAEGIKSSGHVWQAPIFSIVRSNYQAPIIADRVSVTP